MLEADAPWQGELVELYGVGNEASRIHQLLDLAEREKLVHLHCAMWAVLVIA